MVDIDSNTALMAASSALAPVPPATTKTNYKSKNY